jgi:hypothetical protein
MNQDVLITGWCWAPEPLASQELPEVTKPHCLGPMAHPVRPERTTTYSNSLCIENRHCCSSSLLPFYAEGTERLDREKRNKAVANRFPEIKRESKSVIQTFAEHLTCQHPKCFSLCHDHGKHLKFAQARRGC